VLLLIAYPTKALTNPVFYLKLGLIAVAMVILVRIDRAIRAEPESVQRLRRMAAISLVCWTGAIFAGRFLAYTYSRLTATQNF
jgi:hypothetical protein